MSDSPAAAIERELAAGGVVLLDGATGTELERRGAPMDENVWCAMATLSHGDVLRQVHEDYVRAGARVITANTFSTNRTMLDSAGLGDRFDALNRRAVAIALQARERAAGAAPVAVAGSMSHQVPVTRGKDQRDPARIPDPRAAEANFREMAETLADAGVDLILMEMMSDPKLAVPAIAAARATGLPVWVGYSCRESGDGRPVSYSVPELSLPAMLDAIAPGAAGAIGVMHTHPGIITRALPEIRARWDGPVMAYPDSGYFEMPHWRFVDVMTAHDFAREALAWVDSGVQIVGGCCGLGVEHIEALGRALAQRASG